MVDVGQEEMSAGRAAPNAHIREGIVPTILQPQRPTVLTSPEQLFPSPAQGFCCGTVSDRALELWEAEIVRGEDLGTIGVRLLRCLRESKGTVSKDLLPHRILTGMREGELRPRDLERPALVAVVHARYAQLFEPVGGRELIRGVPHSPRPRHEKAATREDDKHSTGPGSAAPAGDRLFAGLEREVNQGLRPDPIRRHKPSRTTDQ